MASMIMSTDEILEEIKRLPLKEQARIIKEIEKYRQEILDELNEKQMKQE